MHGVTDSICEFPLTGLMSNSYREDGDSHLQFPFLPEKKKTLEGISSFGGTRTRELRFRMYYWEWPEDTGGEKREEKRCTDFVTVTL